MLGDSGGASRAPRLPVMALADEHSGFAVMQQNKPGNLPRLLVAENVNVFNT
ncbi:hypothetical protein SDC9_201937 [bioreactor metagenome]|uniref:Uncharacterized protein n=1 Tax=bioreactor metagenome TaxID=1076179 RepID=A0A645ISR4_9ZZZZ